MQQCADAVDGFQHGGGAAVGIDGAEDPGVAMIADDDRFIGILCAGNFSDDIPNGAESVVLLQQQVNLHRAGAHVIGEGQRALPGVGRFWTAERLQNGCGVTIGQRGRGNFWLVGGVGERDAFVGGQVWCGGEAWRRWIAGILEEILNRAALDAALGAIGAVRIDISLVIAVVGRIGVDDDSGRTVLLGDVNFDAAEIFSVADDDDFSFDADVLGGKLSKIFGRAVVGVDDLGGDIAGGGIGVVGGGDTLVVLIRVVDDMLWCGAGHELLAISSESGDFHFFRRVHHDAIRNDFGFEAGIAKFLCNILGGGEIFFRAGNVGRGGKDFQFFTGKGGAGNLEKLLVELALRGCISEAEHGGRRHGSGRSCGWTWRSGCLSREEGGKQKERRGTQNQRGFSQGEG